MPSSIDTTSKWRTLAEIDYYSLFIKTWLAFNSWYKGYYPNIKNDRDCLQEIKKTQDPRNSFYTKFKIFLNGSDRESENFKDNLDGLITCLNRTTLQNSTNNYRGKISFENASTDWNNHIYENLIKPFKSRKSRKLLTVAIDLQDEKIFIAAIEIIYQIRCLLLHGQLEPNVENHEIVKYCYLLLSSILREI